MQLCGHIGLWDSASAQQVRGLWLLRQVKHKVKHLMKSGCNRFFNPEQGLPCSYFLTKQQAQRLWKGSPGSRSKGFPGQGCSACREEKHFCLLAAPVLPGERGTPSKPLPKPLLSYQSQAPVLQGQARPCLQLSQHVCQCSRRKGIEPVLTDRSWFYGTNGNKDSRSLD